MKATIKPSKLKGVIQAPASKSSMQRACAAALIRKGKSIIYNPGRSEDDHAAIGIIQKLGAKVEMKEDECLMESAGFPIEGLEDVEVNCGESGLSARMFIPIISLLNSKVKIMGQGSLMSRPIDFYDQLLPALGVTIKSNKGKLPLTVKGPLQPRTISIDASMSSQFLTGLLFAYAAANANDVSILVNDLKSKPYIDLTLSVMKAFGLKVPENKNFQEFYFNGATPSPELPTPSYTIEGDWSGGAFLLVAGAIAGPITVRGLDITSAQADKKILDALMSANAAVAIEAKGIKVHPAEMNAFEFDATDSPDLFPPLVALAAYCKGSTRISGVNRLVHKESNRALTLWEEFGKMGVDIEVKDDWMTIHGGNGLKASDVYSHHDHRIAMACAVAALGSGGKTTIEQSGAVKKSYPGFFRDLKSLGADVSLPLRDLYL